MRDAIRQACQVVFDRGALVGTLATGLACLDLLSFRFPARGFVVVRINKRRQLLQAFAFRHLALVSADLKIVVHAGFFRTQAFRALFADVFIDRTVFRHGL